MKPTPAGLFLILALAAGWVFVPPTSAQGAQSQQPTAVELSQNPLNLPGIGLEIRLPVGSTSTQQSMSREVFADILGQDNRWRMTMSTRTSANANLMPEDAARQIREDLQQAFAATRPAGTDRGQSFQSLAEVLDDVGPVQFAGGVGYRFILRQPANAAEVPDTIRGVAVIGIGPGQMLVWDMTAPKANYALAKAALDATLAGIVAVDGSLTVPDREIALKTGHALIRGIDPTRMRAAFTAHGQRWYRLYRQGENASEDSEIGYRRVRAWAGKRSDVGGVGSISAAEGRIPGLLVQIEARSLDESSPQGPDRIIYDSKGTYFVSEDFTKEVWNLLVVIKQGKQQTTYSEVGARDGFEELLITTATPTGSNEAFRQKINEEGYLPLPLALILPTILAETKATGDVGFYTYRSDASAVTFRHDSIRHDTDAPNRYIHSTSVSVDSPRITKEVDADGTVLREELPGDRVWVQTTIDELSKIWKAKGLPMN